MDQTKKGIHLMDKIMIVEDDKTISSILKETLAKWGLNPFCVTEFANITEQFIKEEPHLVLLDIGLHYYNGYYWCGEIRKISKVPIIFISSNTDSMDIIMAMNTVRYIAFICIERRITKKFLSGRFSCFSSS